MGDYNDALMRNQNSAGRGATKQQNRANVLQLKLIGQSHPTGLTANLLKLFEPRPPLEFKPPPEKRKCPPYFGMAQFVNNFAEPGDPEYAPPVQEAETPSQRRARIHKLRLEKGAEHAAEELKKYDPTTDPNVSGDPYKTLFVSRLSYETSESRIKREFESYGPIKRVRLVTDKDTNKPKGYAFIEYVHTRDMKAAYKQADGRKIDGRRVLVDVERGRTVPNWRPRRLGGGLGTSRVAGEEVAARYLHKESQQPQGPSRSEEPKARDDRVVEREKSRERGRDREREREKSHDRPRDREHREDRHHRDRDREKDKDRDRDGRRRDGRRDRGGRDHDRERHGRDRDRTRDRDRDYDGGDDDRGRSRDRVDSKHDRDHGDPDYDHADAEEDHGWYEQPEHGRKRSADVDHYDHHRGKRSKAQYDPLDVQGDDDHYDQYADRERDRDRYDAADDDAYRYD
ncbi:U1 small nuclear ribonucleoprotein 70 kDa [Linum grandiflorum]